MCEYVRGFGDAPSFTQRTLDMAQLCAEGELEGARFEEATAIESRILVECGEEKVFLWD